jgi:intein-encoded DNA endonuclease-like protein
MPSLPPLAYNIYANYSLLGRNADTPFKSHGGDIMSVVGIGIMGKRGERRKCLPLEIRMKMYNGVIELRKQGLTCKEIQKRIYEEYGEQVSMQNIYNWINEKHKPLGKVNKFDGKPSPELAYVIGVVFSDGYKYFNNKDRNYHLRLAVNDKEYAEAFGEKLAKLLKRDKPYKTFWNENRKQWITEGYSIRLFKFLDKPLEELKLYIEHCKECVSAFLRALFDGEGMIYRRILRLYNTNEELLIYIQYLLKEYFNIDSTGPHLDKKSGTLKHFPNSKVAKTTKNYYYIYISAKSLLKFYKYIGFTIGRKQHRLIEAIK